MPAPALMHAWAGKQSLGSDTGQKLSLGQKWRLEREAAALELFVAVHSIPHRDRFKYLNWFSIHI